jgi:hypothetical protein
VGYPVSSCRGQPTKRPAAGVDLLTGLFAHYTFNDTLADSSGNGRTLSNASPTYNASGLLGKCLRGGTSSGLATATISSLFSAGTVSAWFTFQNNTATATGQATIAGPGGSTAWVGITALQAARSLSAVTADGTAYTSGTLTPDVWHHMVVVAAGGTLTVYLDGTGVFSGTPPAAATCEKILCQGPSRVGLDEPSFYKDRGLSAAEAAALYNGGVGLDPTA